MDERAAVAAEYREFARTAPESPCLAAWSTAIAEDTDVLDWIAALPPAKRQPNLVLAAARWHGATAPGPYAGLRSVLLADEDAVRGTVLTRSTQTNEVGRLATLLPALGLVARTDGPLALVEAGASAGLCLYPDRYDYAWPPDGRLTGSGGPVLTCSTTGTPPLPDRHPVVAWRGGIDLAPVDVDDPDAVAWLENLVWPEQDDRRRRLRVAVELARREPAAIVQGDLLDRLPEVVATAGRHGRVVVFHSAVVAYLGPARRRRFVELMTDLVADGSCRWVSNEAPGVLPEVTRTAPRVPDAPVFVLGLDGRAMAWTHGHGASLHWFGDL